MSRRDTKRYYVYCAVPLCKSTSFKTPEKIFFKVPKETSLRKKWIVAMRRDTIKNKLSDKTSLHCCEDHFDVENDTTNIIKHRLMGSSLILKKEVLPHKFECQGIHIPHIFNKRCLKQMVNRDVLVCGRCHSVFYLIEEFMEHRNSLACSGKSPVRDCMEPNYRVWAFILWKCSSAVPHFGVSRFWDLYQLWCKMEDSERAAWIAAGRTLQYFTDLSNAKVF